MIAKISKSGSSFQGAVSYNESKVKSGTAMLIDQHKIIGTNAKEIGEHFESLSFQSRTKNKVFHVALSWHEHDRWNLDIDKMKKMGRSYMEEMGYGKQPYLMYLHSDTKHPHIHILSSRVDVETNKKIRDSFEHRQSKAITDKMEQQYNLTVADPQREVNWKDLLAVEKEALSGIKNRKVKGSLLYQELDKEVGKALQSSPKTIAELSRQLKKNGSTIRIKEVGKGLVYFRENAETGKLSKLRRASTFKGMGVDKKGLDKALGDIRAKINVIDNHIHRALQQQRNSGQKYSLLTLEKQLIKHGIEPKYSVHTKEGVSKISGMSYEYEGRKYKASSVSKELSWNKVHHHFVDKEAVRYREQKPSNEPMSISEFSERLKASVHRGEYIYAKFRNNKYHFNSTDKSLEKHLSGMYDVDALKLSKAVNAGVKNKATQGIDKVINNIDKELKNVVNRQLNRGRDYDKGISM